MANVQKTPALDLLRVLAAWMVLAVHAGQVAGLDALTYPGAYGVQLFFILSGYLSEASLARDADPLRYYRRRLARILPAYYLLLAVRWVWDAARGVPTGAGYLRYFAFLQMWLPSDDWALWNNRSALWTMSAFAFFYLLAPWLHRILNSFWRSFAVLVLLLLGKGKLGAVIAQLLADRPQSANISEFSAKTPLMVLYCFLFGTALWHALREGKALFYGGFCLMLPVLLDFERGVPECVLAALVLLALVCPAPRLSEAQSRVLGYLSASSFWLYLFHPLVLDLFPVWEPGHAAALPYMAAVFAVCLAAGCVTYPPVRRLERWCAERLQ